MTDGRSLSIAMTFVLALAGTMASSAVDAAPQRTTFIRVSDTYPGGSAEAQSILDWVAARSPDRQPTGRQGVVSIERIEHFSGASRPTADSSTPPGGLLEKGYPGEEYQVESTLPDGTRQSWGYRWVEPSSGHGGRWDLTGYSFRKGGDSVGIR